MSRARVFTGNSPLPFPIPEVAASEVGFSTCYPLGFPLADIVRFWWRVSNWEFVGLVLNEDGGPTYVPVEEGLRLLGSRNRRVEDETELVAASGFVAVVQGTDATQENNQTISFMTGPGSDACVQSGGLYYPQIVAGNGGGSDPINAGFGFTFLGVPHGFDAEKRVLRPVNYWEYRGQDGAAVYDPFTGAQLREPLTAPVP